VDRFISAADDLLGLQQSELLKAGLSSANREATEAYIEARAEVLYLMGPPKRQKVRSLTRTESQTFG
jgi:hypothetical protein